MISEAILVVGVILVFILSFFLILFIMAFCEEMDKFNLSVVLFSCIIWIISFYSIFELLFNKTLNPILGWTCLVFSVTFLILVVYVFSLLTAVFMLSLNVTEEPYEVTEEYTNFLNPFSK